MVTWLLALALVAGVLAFVYALVTRGSVRIAAQMGGGVFFAGVLAALGIWLLGVALNIALGLLSILLWVILALVIVFVIMRLVHKGLKT
jgi:hypothetical protein